MLAVSRPVLNEACLLFVILSGHLFVILSGSKGSEAPPPIPCIGFLVQILRFAQNDSITLIRTNVPAVAGDSKEDMCRQDATEGVYRGSDAHISQPRSAAVWADTFSTCIGKTGKLRD